MRGLCAPQSTLHARFALELVSYLAHLHQRVHRPSTFLDCAILLFIIKKVDTSFVEDAEETRVVSDANLLGTKSISETLKMEKHYECTMQKSYDYKKIK